VADRTDSKQAEKTYLARSGGSVWEREKPFSPPGADHFEEGLELLNDFVVALWLLQPGPDDRMLDLGAGGGWCSDLLQRMSRRSFAVDISFDMLRVARQRPTRTPIAAAAGDLERLPFADGVFDKAICLSALHHVPDIAAAAREIFRVLNDRGVAVFSEPGVGHADKPWSTSAARDFGVLEQDVLIEPTIHMFRDAGFSHVHVCPISYIIPEFELTDDEWRSWRRLPRVKRPLRAVEKMWRAALELVGAGKKSALFEEAFAMRLVRLLQVPVLEHPFIVAAKTEERRRPRPTYRAAVSVTMATAPIRAGHDAVAEVALANHGTITWRARATEGSAFVQVGIQLLDRESRVINRDFARARLTADLRPGDSAAVRLVFRAPDDPGVYLLKFDLVEEGVTWFEPAGSKAELFQVTVAAANERSK
jgi:SAM-dependent methyltransferase